MRFRPFRADPRVSPAQGAALGYQISRLRRYRAESEIEAQGLPSRGAFRFFASPHYPYMKSKYIVSTTIAIFALTSCLSAEEVKYPPINPALTYWQAAALMPDLKGEKAELLNDAIFGKKPLDDAKVRELLTESEDSLRLFAKAAASSAPCDWGLDLKEGPELGLPHISKIRELSRLAVLKADALFAEDKASEGIDWLLLTHRAARHAGASDLLIAVLVQDSIEGAIIYSAGLHCLGWNDAVRKMYADGLKTLPPPHSLGDAVRNETIFIDWIERLLQSTEPDARRKLHEMLVSANPRGNEPGPEREAEIKLLEEQFTSGNSPKLIAELRNLNLRTQAAMGMPWKESRLALEGIDKETQEGNNVLKMSYPSFESVNFKRFQIATLRTMLDAALQYGPKLDEATAAGFKDAFDGEPLVLRKGEDGSMTLKAARQYWKGKDIELKLGK